MDYFEKLKEKAKAYDEALKLIKECTPDENGFVTIYPNEIFPELAESEDERIRKDCIKYLDWEYQHCHFNEDKMKIEKCVAWLEKQDNKVIDCSQNHQDSNRPNGCIVFEDFNDGEGFYKLHLDYLNKKQLEEVEKLVKTWNKESKTSNENIKNCIGMCLTDANERRFKDFNTNLKDCLAWLEKQGKQKPADKIEPKFKVGDFIKHNKVNIIGKVISVNSNSYYVENIETSYRTELFNVEQKFHLWTIEDAKDGDILTCKNKTFIAKTNINYYCCCDGEQFQTNSLDSLSIDEVKGIKPATKEQCDLLFQKMVEAGYMWDAKNKELLKILLFII